MEWCATKRLLPTPRSVVVGRLTGLAGHVGSMGLGRGWGSADTTAGEPGVRHLPADRWVCHLPSVSVNHCCKDYIHTGKFKA